MGRVLLVVVVVLGALLSIAGPATALPPSVTGPVRALPPASDSPAPSSGSSVWSIQPSPNVNEASGALARDSCVAGTTFCMAVGEYVGTANQYVPLVEIASATRWGLHSAPAPGGQSSDLTSVSCVSSTFCEATGDFVDSAGGHLFGATWNGSSWSIQSIPEPTGLSGQLSSISCKSTTFCEAVGAGYGSSGPDPLVEHYNGSSWSIQSVPVPAGTTAGIVSDISCPSATRCEAVGWLESSSGQRPLAVVFNGSSWADQTIVASGSLTGVSCWTAGACEATGKYQDQAGNAHVMAQRLTSTGWRAQTVPDPPNSGYIDTATISCTGASMCEAVGTTLDPGAPAVPFAEGWNGTEWQAQTVSTQFPGSHLYGVACPASSDCRAVGSSPSPQSTTTQAVAANWNGTSWGAVSAANPVTRPYSSLAAVSCSATTACTAVGQRQTADGVQHTLAQRWNGTDWTTQTTANPTNAILTAVSCANSSACMAVGNINGSVPMAESWSNGTWSLLNVPHPPNFESGQLGGVSCTGPKDCWASGWFIVKNSGGYEPFAAHWDGTSWHDQVLALPTGGVGGQVYGISCHSPNCTAVGYYYDQQANNYPLAERWTGTAWVAQKMHAVSRFPNFISVSCPSSTWCSATGVGGSTPQAEHWNGSTWTVDAVPKPAGTTQIDVNALSCVSSTSCHAVGSYAPSASFPRLTLAEVWNGTNWSVQTTPNRGVGNADSNQLEGVSCLATSGCTAAGSYDNGIGPSTLIETGG